MSDSPIAKLFRQPTIVTALTYEDGLHAARSAIAKEASMFAAAPIFGFSKYTYFLGISKAFMTVYIAGRWPFQADERIPGGKRAPSSRSTFGCGT